MKPSPLGEGSSQAGVFFTGEHHDTTFRCTRNAGGNARARRLRLQHAAIDRRADQGGLGRGGQPVPAPRRSGAESGEYGERLLGATNARSKIGSIQATPELVNDPAAFQKFVAAQGELTSALSRLLVVAENYPQLKSDANFRDLQAQLEGTENRIAVARNRYIKA